MADATTDPIEGLRLFEVEITYTIYVLEEDEMTAHLDAPSYLRDEDGEPDVHAVEVKDVKQIREGAHGSLPHGEGDDDPPTVEECLKIIAARSTT